MRSRQGRYLIEGPQAVREAVRFIPQTITDLYADTAVANPAIANVMREAEAASVPTFAASAEVMRAISSDCQGIAAVAELPLARGRDQLAATIANGHLVMCLPQISDPGNLGTLIRIADAAGADAVVIGAGSVELTNPKVIRSSVGSVFHLPIVTDTEFVAAADRLRAAGYVVLGADGHASQELPNVGALQRDRLAWVFGNEARGLSEAERAACDELAKVPLRGHAESLNVAAAAAVCMYSGLA
ncbi:TrmH family RNA methyltransferase [Bowdeniella nasicola]|uniref:TrmH family RNA methyltransferase n=1 Tax=Bowdeniella nasicola TaxID=208480 RepID=UPI001C9E8230|nr:RNA methyltransferase [Bowdeniella nasicola]